jgi:hypothetical protein
MYEMVTASSSTSAPAATATTGMRYRNVPAAVLERCLVP